MLRIDAHPLLLVLLPLAGRDNEGFASPSPVPCTTAPPSWQSGKKHANVVQINDSYLSALIGMSTYRKELFRRGFLYSRRQTLNPRPTHHDLPAHLCSCRHSRL